MGITVFFFYLLLNLELWNILVQFVVDHFWQINAILCCVLESKNNLWVLTGPYVHNFETSVIMQEILTSTMQWKSPLIVIYDDNPVAWLLQESRKVETLIVALTIWINVTRRAFNVSEISRNDRNILTLYLRAEPGRDPAKSEHFHYPQHSDTQTPTFRAKHHIKLQYYTTMLLYYTLYTIISSFNTILYYLLDAAVN